jgi:ubiquinone/menaquinone biosynthesis C-methylase UbiE
MRNDKNTWDKLWRVRKRMYVYRNVLTTAEHCLGGMIGKTILEVGCGRGATLREFARRGAYTFGLDYSEEALEICRRLQAEDRDMLQGTFVNGDARSLPFSDSSFDFVFSVGLIEHFEEPVALLLEQCRVLKPEGHLLIQVPQKYSLYTAIKKILIAFGKWPYGGWETEYSDREIVTLTKKANMAPTSVYGYGSFVLATARHLFLPNLDFGVMWRNGSELRTIRAVKAKTALDICVVATKSCSSAIAEREVLTGSQ